MFLSRSGINSLRIISVAHDRKHAHIKRSAARSHERLGWFATSGAIQVTSPIKYPHIQVLLAI
jgi:hypothetical protein|tara:strand:+ start:5954 stop:6142 length:189 start_codon:yes stop_codon:yes gene_type:complete